jgi:type III secretory pathway component EscS
VHNRAVTLPLIMKIVTVRAAAAVNYENIGRDILKFAANLRISLPAGGEAGLQLI